jgi:PadR family transcriptional regulator PadR
LYDIDHLNTFMNIKNNNLRKGQRPARAPRTQAIPHPQDALYGSAIFRGPVKTKTILPLLTLHLLAEGPEHGYGLMERIAALTGDIMPVNSNSMYPLLRRLEERGFIVGEWEHPDRRSRRMYRITPSGIARYHQIRERMKPHLDRLIVAVRRLYSAMFLVSGGRRTAKLSRSSKSEAVS